MHRWCHVLTDLGIKLLGRLFGGKERSVLVQFNQVVSGATFFHFRLIILVFLGWCFLPLLIFGNECQIQLLLNFNVMKETGDIIFYESGSGDGRIEVKLEDETVWLSQTQIVELFQSSKANISEHIKHIFKSGELEPGGTVRKFRTVQEEGKRLINRDLDHYSLDMIISIGYRVNSIRGTQFRIWANKILKDYLTKGYAIDHKKFKEQSRQLDELKQTVKLLGNVIERKELNSDEATSAKELFQITYPAAMEAIRGLKDKVNLINLKN